MVHSYARVVPPSSREDRLDRILRAATKVFATRGYRRTQMADVASEAGVSAGNLYQYVESKEALFHACLATADPDGRAPFGDRPLATPDPAETRNLVESALRTIRKPGALAAALETDDPADVAGELAGIIGDFYDRTAATRHIQSLIEAAAADRPDLFEAYFVKMRRPALAGLTEYLRRRMGSGHLRQVPDAATTARLINETQAWFARHRPFDQDTDDVPDDATARATVIDVLVAGLLPRPPTSL